MRILRACIGATIAGLLAGGVWGKFAGEPYGIIGGWFAAFCIISIMWFMNHYIGLIPNKDGAAFIDMATGIMVTCIVRDVLMLGAAELPASLPTFFLVALGGCIGGALAYYVQKDYEVEKSKASQEA